MSALFDSTFQEMKSETDLEAQLRNEFILQQLLALAAVLDLSDEAGRLATTA